MPQLQRSTWAALLMFGMFAPFMVALLLLIESRGVHAAGEAPPTTAAAPLPGPGMVAPPGRASFPMYGAGDERTLWVAHPILYQGKDPAFELMWRSSSSHAWNVVRDARGDSTYNGYPKNLAVFIPPANAKGRAAPLVFIDGMETRLFTATGSAPKDNLPRDHTLLAATGSPAGVFVITVGAPSPSTTEPFDVLNTRFAPPPELEPTATTSKPATTTSQPAAPPAPWLNAYWMKDSRWLMIPPVGIRHAPAQTGTDTNTPDVPSQSALVALAHVPKRLVLLWVEPSNPSTLVARALDYKDDAAKWTAPVTSRLPDPVPQKSRLLTVTVGQSLYVFYPTISSNALELRGGSLITEPRKPGTDLTLPAPNILPPVTLTGIGDGINPATDVIIGPVENSIAAVVNTRNNTLVSFLFNDRGSLMSGPDTVEPQGPRRDVQFAQKIAMLLLILMLTLSFWQWRHRPGPLKLPAGTVIARPGMRSIAFLIDLAIPYLVVCVSFGLWEDEGYVKVLTTLVRSIPLNFDVLFSSPPLLTMLGIYLGHVMIGELFFRRSIGKALTGMQVLMVDGKAPTLAAIVVRNLIRLPEMLLGILVVYMMISPHRQRLGDLLARTLVISQQPPDVPRDVDAE